MDRMEQDRVQRRSGQPASVPAITWCLLTSYVLATVHGMQSARSGQRRRI